MAINALGTNTVNKRFVKPLEIIVEDFILLKLYRRERQDSAQ